METLPDHKSPRDLIAERFKRLLDVSAVLASAPIVVPVIATCAALIRLESKGHPIYTQTRVGKGRKNFRLFKLRTMVENAEHMGAGLYNEKDDPRYTKVGKFLRRTSLDELPQLLNVLRGDMSLIGPRPQLPMIVEQYNQEFTGILQVRPGLTGLSQVNGRNELKRRERLRLDQEYARQWSLLGDLKILAKTALVVLKGEGQRNDQSRGEVEGSEKLGAANDYP